AHDHEHGHDNYDTLFYTRLRVCIKSCIERRFIVLYITIALFVVALAGFTLQPQHYFTSSDPHAMIADLPLPQAASFHPTLKEAERHA
ncbi:hypothetical protein AAHH79_34715, partial [Burkholderia pseudomallei]